MRVDPHYISNLSQAISTSSAAEQRITNELSSGLRINSLSDDPVAAAQATLLQHSISGMDSFVQSSNRVQSLLQVTDSSLGEVVSQVTSALSLAVQAGDGTLSAADLGAIGKKVQDIRDNVLALANTSYGGSYVFSGSKGNIQPFTLDTSTSPAVATYNGDSVTQKIETPDGQKVQTNVPGSAIFAAPGGGLLASLNQLVADLGTGSSASIAADTGQLKDALNNVSTQRTVIGSSLSRLATTSTYAQTQETNLQARQSALLAADPATVATDLKTAEVQHQALLGVVSTLSSVNLFSYIK